jgi:hypothetical protein
MITTRAAMIILLMTNDDRDDYNQHDFNTYVTLWNYEKLK